MQKIKKDVEKWLYSSSYTLFKEHTVQYSISILLTAFFVVVSYYILSYFPFFPVLLFLLIPVLLNTWYGDLFTGLVSFVGIIISYIIFFVPIADIISLSTETLFSIVMFAVTAILIAYYLDRAKKTDEVAYHKELQLNYLDNLKQEKEQRKRTEKEIQARDEFLSIASHELKTPLTLSLLQIQRALHNIRNVSLANFSVAKLMDMLESVEQQTDRLSQMISDLSNVSFITTGRLELEHEEVDLNQILKNVIERTPVSMRKSGYPIEYKPNGELVGEWDKLRLEQVLINLVSNAIKYGENKPVAIETAASDSHVTIRVKDNGSGVPKHMKDQIFERFKRAHNGKKVKGLGVGLYITKQIVEAHGGKIDVQTREGQGSTFAIQLPRKKDTV